MIDFRSAQYVLLNGERSRGEIQAKQSASAVQQALKYCELLIIERKKENGKRFLVHKVKRRKGLVYGDEAGKQL